MKIAPMSEQEIKDFMARQVNRRAGDSGPVDPDFSLAQLVCYSNRSNAGRYLLVNEHPTALLTWKLPPKSTWGWFFRDFSSKLLFPFTVWQVWASVNPRPQKAMLNRNKGPAAALEERSRETREWLKEANDYLDTLALDGAAPFNWKFQIIVSGVDRYQLEERMGKVGAWSKTMNGADTMEEGKATRVIAELATIPGNTWANGRKNPVTSRNVGDLAMVYRLGKGDPRPNMLFGDRNNGVYGMDLFSSKLPSWNTAVLGKPGSGKSVLMNKRLMALSTMPFQSYIMDEGNSYHSVTEFFAEDMPGEVATMRIRGGDFKFNPLPLAWALRERERQVKEGVYRLVVEGEMLADPVEAECLMFENWLEVLLGDGERLPTELKNRLDKALKGEKGDKGFFLDFTNQCKEYNEALRCGQDMAKPRPLSQLLTFVRNEVPELTGALEIWTRGERAKYFDSGEDSISNARLVYFELTGIKDDAMLSRPFAAALMTTIWRRISDPTRLHERKAVTLDEAWKWLTDPVFSKVVEEMGRTIRKFRGYIEVSTQTTDDLNSPGAQKILKTMSNQFVFPGFTDRHYFKTVLQLSDDQIALHENLEHSDCRREALYWNSTGLVRALDVVLTPTEYWFSTSHAADKIYRSALTKKLGLRAAIKELAKACGHKTIPSEDLRIGLVEDYLSLHHQDLGFGRKA
jgi:type IV secretory pathway VirB4 component